MLNLWSLPVNYLFILSLESLLIYSNFDISLAYVLSLSFSIVVWTCESCSTGVFLSLNSLFFMHSNKHMIHRNFFAFSLQTNLLLLSILVCLIQQLNIIPKAISISKSINGRPNMRNYYSGVILRFFGLSSFERCWSMSELLEFEGVPLIFYYWF